MTRLVYIANVRLPTEKAHGIQIMKTCEALARQGVEIELVVPRRLNRLKDDSFMFYGVEKNFKITKVWCLDLISWNIFGALGFWIESWTFYRSVKKYLSGQSEAVYYTRDLSIAYWFSKVVSPVFYEIHTLPDVITSKYKKAWERAKGLIVISEGLKDQLVVWGVKKEKIQGAIDAVDVKQFQITENKQACRQKLNLPLEQKIVVYTGHLYEWKGASLLAEATSMISSDIQVYLVGGTEQDVTRFKALYQAPNLHIVGWQPHQLIPYWDRAGDVLVLPTSGKEKIGAVYTSPLKLFEYLVSGTPIVAARLPSLQEFLTDKDVLFFEADNAADLARAIKQSITDPPPTKAWPGFSWESRAAVIKNFISKV